MEHSLIKEAKEFAGLWGGFRASRVALTANNLRVFENIGKGRSSDDLAEGLRTDPRATEILLDGGIAGPAQEVRNDLPARFPGEAFPAPR